jgi:N4-gp56 family major capsid protein
VAFEQTLLRNARPLACYFIGSQPGELAMHRGTATIGWRRFNTSADNSNAIAPSTTALSELQTTAAYGMGRNADTVHRTDTSATVAKYGQFFYVNEEVDVFNFNNTMDGIVQTLAITAGRSLNYLHRNTIEDNITLRYAGNVASDGVVESVITAGDLKRAINEIDANFGMLYTPMTTGSTNIGTTPHLPSYLGFCHTDVAVDIAGITGFKSVETYAGQVNTYMGEFGSYALAGKSVRFISTPEASIDAGAGEATSGDFRSTSGSNDLYTVVIKAMHHDGSVGLGKQMPDGSFMNDGNNPSPIELIVKGRNTNKPSGIDDPFDEVMSVAYKMWYAGTVLNANWGRGIRVAATNLANAPA